MKFLEELNSIAGLYGSSNKYREIQVRVMGWNLKKLLTIWYKHSIDNIYNKYTWHGYPLAKVSISGFVNDQYLHTAPMDLDTAQTFVMKLYILIYGDYDEEMKESAREWIHEYILEDESVSNKYDPRLIDLDAPKDAPKVSLYFVFSVALPRGVNARVISDGVRKDMKDLANSGNAQTDYSSLFDEMMHVRYNSSDEVTNSKIREEWRKNNASLGKGIKRPAQEHFSHTFLKQSNKITRTLNIPATCLAIKMFQTL